MQLALAQRASGHEVEVACDTKRTTTTSEELLVPRLEPLELLSALPLELSVKSTPWAMARDVLTLRRARVDVVHTHFSHDGALLRLARPKGAVTVRSFHAPRSLRRSAPKAHGYTVPVESWLARLRGENVLVLPALVGAEFVPSSNKAALRAELKLPPGRLIGMVSTFQASRRHELALRAFARRTDDASLILVGDGPLKDVLVSASTERVHFVGYHSGAAFIRYLQCLDEVWILGLGNDWSARAAAQARACGVRVVAVDEGALDSYADEIIEPTEEALLSLSGTRREVTLESPQAIATRVVQFYESLRSSR